MASWGFNPLNRGGGIRTHEGWILDGLSALVSILSIEVGAFEPAFGRLAVWSPWRFNPLNRGGGIRTRTTLIIATIMTLVSILSIEVGAFERVCDREFVSVTVESGFNPLNRGGGIRTQTQPLWNVPATMTFQSSQ